MLRGGETVVAAVSGGPDSVALLHALHALAPELGIALHAAHFHHGLRGAESEEDARFVEDLAGRLGVPVHVGRGDVRGFARRHKVSLQVAGRTLRYRFLRQCLADVGGQRVALGHILEDQAETVLMRMLRGTGLHGLGGIPPVRGPLIRPLLEVSRAEVLAYLESHGVPFRMDSSNAQPVCLRNRIRLELVPLLRTYNPRAVEALARTARLLREEATAMDTLLGERLSALLHEEGEGHVALDLEALSSLPPGLRRRVLREGVRRVLGGLDGISARHVEALQELADRKGTGSRLSLPRGLEAQRDYGKLRLARSFPHALARGFSRPLAVPGTTAVPEAGILVKAEYTDRAEAWTETAACFDAGRLPGPLGVRSRRPGDRFYPLGMQGSKRLQDFFVDRKVPRALRDRVPLLTAGEQILWVMGGLPEWPKGRLDRRYLADARCTHVLRVQVTPMENPACFHPHSPGRSSRHP